VWRRRDLPFVMVHSAKPARALPVENAAELGSPVTGFDRAKPAYTVGRDPRLQADGLASRVRRQPFQAWPRLLVNGTAASNVLSQPELVLV
jgi:hypothetical protein